MKPVYKCDWCKTMGSEEEILEHEKTCMKNNFPIIMKFAAFAAVTLTALLVLAYVSFCREWMLICAISTGTTAYHFVMRLAVGYSLPKLTNYNFDYRHRWFHPRKWEPIFYRKH